MVKIISMVPRWVVPKAVREKKNTKTLYNNYLNYYPTGFKRLPGMFASTRHVERDLLLEGNEPQTQV